MRIIVSAAAAAIFLFSSGPGSATVIDFATLSGGHVAGTQGVTMSLDGVTLTARTGINKNTGDPLLATPPAKNGVAGDIYWGTLGNLGVTGQTYTGLGVQTAAQAGTTSGGPINPNEALVIAFDQPALMQSIAVTLEGLVNANGTDDVFAIRVQTLFQGSGGVNSGVNDIVSSAVQTFSFNDPGFWPGPFFAHTGVSAIAVWSISGAFGLKALSYDTVPEPMTLALFGAGLLGLAATGRRKKR